MPKNSTGGFVSLAVIFRKNTKDFLAGRLPFDISY
jgi:hypothetical protein